MKHLVFASILFLWTFTVDCIAQRTITSSSLLQEQITSPLTNLLDKNLDFLRNENQKMPLIDELEFRTESDEMDWRRQEYLFRVSFNGKRSRKVQDAMTNNSIQRYELQAKLIEANIIVDRYEWIAEWYYLDRRIDHLKAERIILEDKSVVYQRMAANATLVDISNVLKIKEDLQELERDLLKLENERALIIQQLLPGQKVDQIGRIDSTDWVSMETMTRFLAKIDSTLFLNLRQVFQANRIEQALIEYDLEEAEKKQILDFVQLKYAGRDNQNAFREFSAGVGFTIPHKASARVDLNEAQLDILEEEFEQAELMIDIEQELAELSSRFNQILDEKALILQQIEENELQKTLDFYLNKGNVHPLTLLQLKELLLKDKKDLRRLDEEACSTFLKILEIRGLLYLDQSSNYLSDKTVDSL